ncbi:MAG: energy transducer TonB [Terriglobales bacterium]
MGSRSIGPMLVVIFSVFLLVCSRNAASQSSPQNADGMATQPHMKKLPSGVILVKGAWYSASDSTTPVPEGGRISNGNFSDQYFGMSYALPPGWTQKYEGPPPSNSGRYSLAQLTPADTHNESPASILIGAQDLFFTHLPANNALDFVDYTEEHLPTYYKLDFPPADIKIAGHPFRLYGYEGLVTHLHWYVATTEIRCHALEIVLTSPDAKRIDSLLHDMNTLKLPSDTSPTGGTGGGDFPVCIKDYANDDNLISRVEPVFPERRFNPVPVRIIIARDGKVKHIHVISAFPEQAAAVMDALKGWKFKPYLRDGHPFEVETGIVFGRASYPSLSLANSSAAK